MNRMVFDLVMEGPNGSKLGEWMTEEAWIVGRARDVAKIGTSDERLIFLKTCFL